MESNNNSQLQEESTTQTIIQPTHEETEISFDYEKWGQVDEENNVWLINSKNERIKKVGTAFSKNSTKSLEFFARRFQKLLDNFAKLASEYESTEKKHKLMTRVKAQLNAVKNSEAIGDYDTLIKKLESMQDEISVTLNANLKQKAEICEKIEFLATATDWKTANEEINKLREEWKTVGFVSEEESDQIYSRFKNAIDNFYIKKSEFFESLDREKESNLVEKKQLIEIAEKIAESEDWTSTTEHLKSLMEKWKNVGPVPKDESEALWQRFKAAHDKFYSRKNSFYQEKDQERLLNQQAKEKLIEEAEMIASNPADKDSIQRIIEVQAQWKTIGPVSKAVSDEIWNKFHTACNKVFEEVTKIKEQKKLEWQSKQTERKQRMEEVLKRLEESIVHDENNVARWKNNLYALTDSEEDVTKKKDLELKIADVEKRIEEKTQKIQNIKDELDQNKTEKTNS